MKMDFSELEYLAFEGGGGKGAVYKGAVVALEKLFDTRWKKGTGTKMVGGALTEAEAGDAARRPGDDEGEAGTSILDYHGRDGTLQIKGISGSSAGAITAFPLALGLTSEHIEKILTSYRFKEELLPNHRLNEGKYRMVGMDGEGKAQLLVGEDQLRKLGEDNVTRYQVQLFGEGDAIGGNGLKSTIRSTVVAAAFSVMFTGLIEKWGIVRRTAQAVGDLLQKVNYLKQASAWLKSNVVQNAWSEVFENPNVVRLLTSFTPVSLNLALKQLLRLKVFDLNRLPWGSKNLWKIKGLLPTDNVVAAVGNLFWDRGIYAGFEVRELFFKILLLAVSEDTRFSRRLKERTALLESLELEAKHIQDFTLTLDTRLDVQRPADAQGRGTLEKLKLLQERLTFRELYEITRVNLTICVTNSTTAQPIYFSHYFTPDFPVLEAVGASMSFPLAFKPVYNEANVLLHQETRDDGTGKKKEKTRSFLNPSDFVEFRPHGHGALLFKESFPMREYDKHLGIVLAYVKQTSTLGASVNGNLSFRSFLPYLREIIENDRFDSFQVKHHERNASETYDAGYMKALCYFYYNSAFKGLLFDGGATNNLPAAVFTFQTAPQDRETVQDLDIKQKILSLKLDSSFPEEIRSEAFDLLERDPKILERVSAWDDEAGHRGFAERIFASRRLRKALREKASQSSLPGPAWVKISRELVAEHRRTMGGFTPWNRDAFVALGVLSALQFGFDQGQIESIDDNENIIPLYCYGLGTFDFDLTSDAAEALVKLAVEESEKAVWSYFDG